MRSSDMSFCATVALHVALMKETFSALSQRVLAIKQVCIDHALHVFQLNNKQCTPLCSYSQLHNYINILLRSDLPRVHNVKQVCDA